MELINSQLPDVNNYGNWVSIDETQPTVNEPVLICECLSGHKPLMAVSYWDGTYDEYNGVKLYKFPDGQDEQPGYYYPSYWTSLPQAPIKQ